MMRTLLTRRRRVASPRGMTLLEIMIVVAILGHALVQRAGPKRLHALLQGLQAARQAAHHRPGPRGHGQEQQHHQRQSPPPAPTTSP